MSVWTFEGGALVQEFKVSACGFVPHLLDRFPDGRWLLAGGEGACLLAQDGTQVRHLDFGEGIRHLKIDAAGRIWVGWADEGVFGNAHWRVPGVDAPPSSYGMAAFDDHGNLLKCASVITVVECYALNAFGDEAWACPYTEFPIWRMTGDQEHVWRTSLDGVCAIAVHDPNILAAGGYDADANLLQLLKLTGNKARVMKRWRLPFNRSGPASGFLLDGRGDQLHLVHDGVWHRWRVTDFLE